ncbi:hypothetical protein [Desulforamulus reducens]|uniref:hypothetical protein n=1 Tax=Desulforamulus reducens TaxID=59610 RepID=UPI00059E2612|nr:hypothetical protein [Desulforamulus reducens]
MPRKNRIWYPGAVYHIMCRGNHRLNPVRANIEPRPDLYKWSSYNVYMGDHQDQLTTTEKILGCFSPPRVKNYRQFVEQPLKFINFTPKGDEVDGDSN